MTSENEAASAVAGLPSENGTSVNESPRHHHHHHNHDSHHNHHSNTEALKSQVKVATVVAGEIQAGQAGSGDSSADPVLLNGHPVSGTASTVAEGNLSEAILPNGHAHAAEDDSSRQQRKKEKKERKKEKKEKKAKKEKKKEKKEQRRLKRERKRQQREQENGGAPDSVAPAASDSDGTVVAPVSVAASTVPDGPPTSSRSAVLLPAEPESGTPRATGLRASSSLETPAPRRQVSILDTPRTPRRPDSAPHASPILRTRSTDNLKRSSSFDSESGRRADDRDESRPGLGESGIYQHRMRQESFVKHRKAPHAHVVLEHKRNVIGDIVYKTHSSYKLMISIQTGIRYSVGKIAQLRVKEVLSESMEFARGSEQLFHSRGVLSFPAEGSPETPPHQAEDFKWKDYAPIAFRHLRQKFNIDPADYMVSVCNTQSDGGNALRELPTPGKSGSLFFFSHDMKYILKTIPKAEAKLLRELLPAYYKHVMDNGDTLLPRFFGLHRIKPHAGPQVRFVVMGNVFNTPLKIHTRYDLKGSTLGRAASEQEKIKFKENVTLKDLDWINEKRRLHLGPERSQKFLDQLHRDCAFLRKLGVMDYSLLVGIHDRTREPEDLETMTSAQYPSSRQLDPTGERRPSPGADDRGSKAESDDTRPRSTSNSRSPPRAPPGRDGGAPSKQSAPAAEVQPASGGVSPSHPSPASSPQPAAAGASASAKPTVAVTAVEGSVAVTTVVERSPSASQGASAPASAPASASPLATASVTTVETVSVVAVTVVEPPPASSSTASAPASAPSGLGAASSPRLSTAGGAQPSGAASSGSASPPPADSPRRSLGMEHVATSGSQRSRTTSNELSSGRPSVDKKRPWSLRGAIQDLFDAPVSEPQPPRPKAQTDYPLPDRFIVGTSIFTQDYGGMRGIDGHGQPTTEHYFIGIIDILMKYDLKKWIEKTYKVTRYHVKGSEVSAVNPDKYAERFERFVTTIVAAGLEEDDGLASHSLADGEGPGPVEQPLWPQLTSAELLPPKQQPSRMNHELGLAPEEAGASDGKQEVSQPSQADDVAKIDRTADVKALDDS